MDHRIILPMYLKFHFQGYLKFQLLRISSNHSSILFDKEDEILNSLAIIGSQSGEGTMDGYMIERIFGQVTHRTHRRGDGPFHTFLE